MIYNLLCMSKEFDENNAKDVYQKARAVVIDLGNQQREQAILYIKKIEYIFFLS